MPDAPAPPPVAAPPVATGAELGAGSGMPPIGKPEIGASKPPTDTAGVVPNEQALVVVDQIAAMQQKNVPNREILQEVAGGADKNGASGPGEGTDDRKDSKTANDGEKPNNPNWRDETNRGAAAPKAEAAGEKPKKVYNSNPNAKDYYERLGVSKTADIKEIKAAHKQAALKYHPDRNPDNKDQATADFQKIEEAYEALEDEDKRRKYDEFGPDGYAKYARRRTAASNARKNEPADAREQNFRKSTTGQVFEQNGMGDAATAERLYREGRISKTELLSYLATDPNADNTARALASQYGIDVDGDKIPTAAEIAGLLGAGTPTAEQLQKIEDAVAAVQQDLDELADELAKEKMIKRKLCLLYMALIVMGLYQVELNAIVEERQERPRG